MPNQHFLDILKRSEEIHLKKSRDYTTKTEENPFENFERAALIASWFPDKYKSFAVLIGTKLARLAALLTKEEQSGYHPSNESTDDSFLDLLTYVGLFFSFWKSNHEQEQTKLTSELPKLRTASSGFESCNVHDTMKMNCNDCLKSFFSNVSIAFTDMSKLTEAILIFTMSIVRRKVFSFLK